MNNRFTLLVASFMTLIAAGVGFAIRGGILGDWGAQFGFTKSELGGITGGGLVGFGVVILFCSLVVDRVGYKPLLILAFVLHVLSAVLTLAATPIYNALGKDACYQCLYWGMFLFSVANGVCESVINPLIATVYSKEKTHYLNILHAGWPGGLILGGVFAYLFCGGDATITHLRWEVPMAMFLVPTVIYGLIVLKEPFPVSEASAAGVSFGQMLSCFASPVLLLLLLLHAMIGYVELGTDSWITNIMNNVVGNYAILLFIYTSSLMFILRFFAGPIVERVNPVGLLLGSSILGCIGLFWLGSAAGISVLIAGTVYALGKTFLWPTILGVVGERFPKGGALVMGAMGGIGMLSAGLLGGPVIGYKQDFFASRQLNAEAPEVAARFEVAQASGISYLPFLPAIRGLDGAKVALLTEKDGEADLNKRIANLEKEGKSLSDDKNLATLSAWWEAARPHAAEDKPLITAARLYGGRMALKWTALVPFSMAIGFGILFVYFQLTGGYQAIDLRGHHPKGEEFTGGVAGPAEY
ncbi:MAG: MFS transporter [Pirellulaceae bacterium]|nr:MFS transporter [Pirellulaceae bacterium]